MERKMNKIAKKFNKMSVGEPSESDYPNLHDHSLPTILGCPRDYNNDEVAEQAFRKICPKGFKIVEVEGFVSSPASACFWRVYYGKKYDDDEDSVPPPNLPLSEQELKEFYDKVTLKAHVLDLEAKPRLDNTGIVEFFPKCCECQQRDYSSH